MVLPFQMVSIYLRILTYDMSENTDLMVFVSIRRIIIQWNGRTLRTSSALRCNAMSFSGFTTGMMGTMERALHASRCCRCQVRE